MFMFIHEISSSVISTSRDFDANTRAANFRLKRLLGALSALKTEVETVSFLICASEDIALR